MVQSVPGELSLQETSVLTVASNQEQGSVTIDLLIKELKFVLNAIKFQQSMIFIEKTYSSLFFFFPAGMNFERIRR